MRKDWDGLFICLRQLGDKGSSAVQILNRKDVHETAVCLYMNN